MEIKSTESSSNTISVELEKEIKLPHQDTNPTMTFENFIVGPSNIKAFEVFCALAKQERISPSYYIKK